MPFPSWTSFPPPTHLGCHRAPGFNSLCETQEANSHWLSNFTYGNVYISMLLSEFIPLSPFTIVSTVCSLCLCLLCCHVSTVYQYHLFKFCIYVFSSVQSLSCVWFFVTSWTTAHQASLSITIFWSLLKLMSIELMMLSNRLILCHPLTLPSIFPSIRVFSNESALCIR